MGVSGVAPSLGYGRGGLLTHLQLLKISERVHAVPCQMTIVLLKLHPELSRHIPVVPCSPRYTRPPHGSGHRTKAGPPSHPTLGVKAEFF